MDTEILTSEEEALAAHLPYLIFKISDVLYAVNGETINSIFVLEQPVTRVPMTEPHIKGIINVRGEVVPLVDVRILFGLQTIDMEKEAFSSMLNSRKNEHLAWVEALEISVESKTEFKLATDPHQCNFGKWYDSYMPNHNEINFALKKIDEPHKKLHACAEEALAHCQDEDAEAGKEAAKRIVDHAKNQYVKTLLGLIDQMEQAYIVAAKQMVVILQKDKTQIGVLVDEVMEVTDIEGICSLDNITTTHHSRYIHGVGTAEQYDKDILMVDVEQIIHNSHNNLLGVPVV